MILIRILMLIIIKNVTQQISWNNNSNYYKKNDIFLYLYLTHGDSTFSCEFFFSFFTWIWITQVWIEILVEDFRGLFAKVSSFTPVIKSNLFPLCTNYFSYVKIKKINYYLLIFTRWILALHRGIDSSKSSQPHR